jgi:uncharacterized membrane protein
VKGMKGTFWGAGVVIGLIYLVIDTVFSLILLAFLAEPPSQVVKSIYNGFVGALLTPLTMGMTMMCVRRALGQPISFSTAFSYFSRFGPALAAGLLVTLFTYVGLMVLIIPGIYLGVAYSLTIPLVGDQQFSASDAMTTSRQAISHRWWRVFRLFVVVVVLMVLSMLPLFIPLIWTFPWAMMTTAVLYRRIFYAPPRAEVSSTVPIPSPGAGAGPPPIGV